MSAATPKLTIPSYIVLSMVRNMEEATPYQMKQFASASIDHFWSIRHAQLYSEPDRLVGGGYLTVRHEEGGRRRKHYRLTEAGGAALDAWLVNPTVHRIELRDEALLKLFSGADPVALAHEQIAIREAHLNELNESFALFSEHMTPGQRLGVQMGIEVEKTVIAHWQAIATAAH